MRLHNPTGVGGPRATPPEGLLVDGVYIPGGSNIMVSIDSIQRSELSTLTRLGSEQMTDPD